MATYPIPANLTDQGIRNIKGTVKRVETFRGSAKKVGTNVKDFYWTLGQYDCALVIEAPDDATVTGLALGVGAIGNMRTQVLRPFTEQEIIPILGRMP
jgi:uncharacterized protein with GYD domain